MDRKQVLEIVHNCTRFLSHGYPETPQRLFEDLAASTPPDLSHDNYGQGELIADFEQEVAGLLGKEAAVFMPSGTMCQQIALRIWAEQRGTRTIAFHPKCHLEMHEHHAYRHLHNLKAVLLGSPDRLFTQGDLERAVASLSQPLGALLIELPQREIGGQLPTWDELVMMTNWARERQIPLHMDGARLWECKPFYQRDYAEIARLFDSVYVSFYKGLQGLSGAMLAGPADLIAASRIWQRRHGGNLFRLFPFVLANRRALALRLERMESYHRKAVEVAAALARLPQIEVLPDPPHTNMMHLYLRGDRDRLREAALKTAQESGVWLFGGAQPTVLPSLQVVEVTVGDATLDLTEAEIVGLFERLFTLAEATE